MGSLFEELEAREASARVRVGELEEQLAEVAGRLEEAREDLDRLRIARETVSDVMPRCQRDASAVVDAEPEAVGTGETEESSAYAGAERQVAGVLAVPHRRPRWTMSALPKIYRDKVEVVRKVADPLFAQRLAFHRLVITLSYFLYWHGRDPTQLPGCTAALRTELERT